jgi:chorismate dehydratase
MDEPDKLPRLRLADASEASRLARELERESLSIDRKREVELEQSLAGFRVGSVHYLNAVPLTRGLEDQILFAPPSQLGGMLHRGELDAALLSITEAILNDDYDVLDGVAIAALGEVQSVILVHRGPIESIREVHCDPASLASVLLLRVLLAERGIFPKVQKLTPDASVPLPEYALLIGDRALDYVYQKQEGMVWDLGAAWYELTQLPFVFAAWVLRRGLNSAALCQQLREAKAFGLDTMDYIISSRTDYDADFRRDYLTWHVHYHMGADEKRGLSRFVELLRKHQFGPVFDPRFVS